MSVENPLITEANRARRAAESALARERAFIWQRKIRIKASGNVNKENIYQLHTSNTPTGEFRSMPHVEAVALNDKMKNDFKAKVCEAIDNGGRYDGKLSCWRIYKHHTEIESGKDQPEEGKKAKRQAVRKLYDDLRSRSAFKSRKGGEQ